MTHWKIHKPICNEIVERQKKNNLSKLSVLYDQAVDFIKGGSSDLLKQLLDENPSLINFQHDEYHKTCLVAASTAYGQVWAVQMLVERGANVDLPNAYDDTPLGCAATKGLVAIAELLILKGADINRQSRPHLASPLYWAVRYFQIDMIYFLCDRGANINIQNSDGITPLYQSLLCEDAPMRMRLIKTFIGLGSDANLRQLEGYTALIYASQYGQSDVVKLLLEKKEKLCIDVNAANYLGHTSLFSSVFSGHTSIVQLLVDHGADVNMVKNKEKRVPLMVACQEGRVKEFSILMSKGANYKALDDTGFTALHFAANSGNIECMNVLLGLEGVSINLACEQGYTPLIRAAMNGHGRSVEILLSAGANVRPKCSQGNNAIQWALMRGHTNVARILMNADPEAPRGLRFKIIGHD